MVQTEARVMASSLVEYDTIDKYVDYDLYTQTVDPNRQAPWIYEGDYNHKHSVENGRKIREQQLNVLLPMLAVASEMPCAHDTGAVVTHRLHPLRAAGGRAAGHAPLRGLHERVPPAIGADRRVLHARAS